MVADALAEFLPGGDEGQDARRALDMADAAISAYRDTLRGDRMAIVELPEPTYVDDDAQVFFGEFDIRADPTGTPAYRTVTTDFCMGSEFKVKWSSARAYWWGRHLIAAALETGYGI